MSKENKTKNYLKNKRDEKKWWTSPLNKHVGDPGKGSGEDSGQREFWQRGTKK